MKGQHGDIGWGSAVVQATRDLSPTVREFTLVPDSAALDWPPGSHLQLRLSARQLGGLQTQAQVRSYSLVGEPDGCYRIAVKRLDDGRGGSLAMWRLAVGDRVDIGEPQNDFALDLNAPGYLLVAGGIGITPLARMARQLAARGAPVRMLYAAKSHDELAYGDVLQACLGDRLCQAPGSAARALDFAAEIARLPEGAQVYACGPVSLMDALRLAWDASGRPPADLRFETFGSSGHMAAQAFRVRIPRHALDITVPAGSSLLDALEQAGVQALSDCRRGECGLCAMDVLAVDGAIDHRDVFLSAHEKSGNTRICACVSRVVGSVTLDTAYRADPA
jgi:vanillate O-demethylase ferredoxin subunit